MHTVEYMTQEVRECTLKSMTIALRVHAGEPYTQVYL